MPWQSRAYGDRMLMISRFVRNSSGRLRAFDRYCAGLLATVPVLRAQETARGQGARPKTDVRLRLQSASRFLQSRGLHRIRARDDQRTRRSDVARNESDDLTLQAFVQEYGPACFRSRQPRDLTGSRGSCRLRLPLLALYVLWEVVRALAATSRARARRRPCRFR